MSTSATASAPSETSHHAPPPAAVGKEPSALMRALVAILTVAFLVKPYLLENELVHDGRKLVTNHEVLSQVQEQPGKLTETLSTSWWGNLDPEQALYRPVSQFVIGLAGIVSGEAYDVPGRDQDLARLAMPYKLFALALKVICALLVVELAWLYLRTAAGAVVAGLLFATLPVHGEVLFDVVGIAELLAVAFGLGAWCLWLRAGDKPGGTTLLYLGSALLVFLASLSKEGAFALPLVFFLADTGRRREGGFGAGLGHALGKLPGLALLVLALAGSLALRYAVLGRLAPEYPEITSLVNPLWEADPVTRVMNGLRLMALSIPAMLGVQTLSGNWDYSVDYSYRQVEALEPFAAANLIGVAALAVLVLGSVALFKKLPLVASLVLALVGSLLLTSNVPFAIGTVYGDRLLLAPSVVMVLLVGCVLGRLGVVGIGLALLLSIGGGYWTWARSGQWTTPADLWRYTAERTAPNSALAHYNLGSAYVRDQLKPFAKLEYERAAELYPEFVDAHMALAALEADDPAAMVEHMRDAFLIQVEETDYVWEPEEGLAISRPSVLLERMTQFQAIDPKLDPEGHLAWLDDLAARGYESPYLVHRRADTLRGMGRFEEAEAELRRSIAMLPTPPAIAGLARFLRLSDRDQEAVELIDEHVGTLEQDPDRDERLYREFLLIRAEAEVDTDPEQALVTVEQILKQEPEGDQLFRALLVRSQASLDLAPPDPVETAERMAAAAKDLMRGLAAYPYDDARTAVAATILSDILPRQGNDAARTLLENVLRSRESPTMRARLGDIYYREGRHDDAAIQFELAVDGLTNDAGELSSESAFVEVRTLQLHNLDLLDTPEAEAEILALLEQDRQRGLAADWRVRMQWYAARGEYAAAREALDGLVRAAPEQDTSGLAGLIDHMEDMRRRLDENPSDLEAMSNLANDELLLMARPQALARARQVVELSGSEPDDTRALRLMLLSRALAVSEGPGAAREPLLEAKDLQEVSPEGRAAIERELAILDALLG